MNCTKKSLLISVLLLILIEIFFINNLMIYAMKQKNLMRLFKKNDTVNWCGYEWECCMEGNRIIHGDLPWYWMDKNQVFIDSENSVYLYLAYSPKSVKYWDGNTYTPSRACGTLRSTKSFSYGTFSADIKLPKGSGLWPSFWLSGDHNWPPEIDIMEAWDTEKEYFNILIPHFPYINPSWKTTTNVHFLDDDMSKCDLGSKNISIFKQPKNPTKHFVNYKVEWFPDRITFYINDKVVRSIKNDTCKKLVENLNHKDKGFKMDVIFNVWCENPSQYEVNLDSPMIIKNFKYVPFI